MAGYQSVAQHSETIKEFLEELYGEQEGWVYCPTKNPETAFWQQYFFQWPEQKDQILTHISQQSRVNESYVAPALFNKASDKKVDFKGSHYVWAEFDGNAPESLPVGIPNPSIRIQSSEKGHEHWYWRLNRFETESGVLEQLAKRLAYTLDADRSGWDSSQVLRPPGTLHHESRRRVRVLKAISGEYPYTSFKNLAETPPDVVVNTNLKDVPDIQSVIAKYKWPKDVLEMFKRPEQPKGSRSSAMTRLAFDCVEMGMSNEEIYSVLFNADERWKKFAARPPEQRAARLIGLIQHVRTKKSTDSELKLSDNDLLSYTLGDFLETEIRVNWVFQNLLHEQGLGIIAATPGVGKSQVSFQMAFHTALERTFLKWECHKRSKTLLLSLEMGHVECKVFLDTMLQGYPDEDRQKLRESIIIVPLGYKLPLDKKEGQDALLDILDQHEIDFIVIDSLKTCVSKLAEEEVDSLFDFINKDLRTDRKSTVWIVHHLRKPGNEGSRKPTDISDLYGDQYIGAHATSVIALWRRSKNQIEVMNFKTRLAAETDPFMIKRTSELNFYVDDSPVEEDEPPVAKAVKKSDESNPKSSRGIPM